MTIKSPISTALRDFLALSRKATSGCFPPHACLDPWQEACIASHLPVVTCSNVVAVWEPQNRQLGPNEYGSKVQIDGFQTIKSYNVFQYFHDAAMDTDLDHSFRSFFRLDDSSCADVLLEL